MSSLAPQRNEALVIRRAKPADAAEIARVQVQSWREAYAGIVPQPYLDRLSVPAHERHWRQSLGGGEWAFVAEWERRIIGFANGGLSRVRRDITGELYVLYELARCGHHGLLVWVLADNPARGFYERLGGHPAGENHVLVGGKRLREIAYVWPD
jgi:hypothetical protein